MRSAAQKYPGAFERPTNPTWPAPATISIETVSERAHFLMLASGMKGSSAAARMSVGRSIVSRRGPGLTRW